MPQTGSSTASEHIAPLSARERLILAEWERATFERFNGLWGLER